MNDESYITSGPGGISFVGPDAIHLFRAVTLKNALGLMAKGIVPTRGLTLTKAFAIAKEYTGKTYKSSKSEIPRAIIDLEIWIATMKAALPVDRTT